MMSDTYIPINEIENYVDQRLRNICSASVLAGTEHKGFMNIPMQRLKSEEGRVDELTSVIEYHGLSGLLYSLSKKHDIDFSLPVSMVIKASTAKHSQRWEAIKEVLNFISADVAQGIDFCLLKGTALATEIYDEPYHRAMSDIDIMCSPENAQTLYEQCLEKGFTNSNIDSYEQSKHHHFPVLSKKVGQHRVDLEIHTHALSFDLSEQLHWSDINECFRSIHIDGEPYLTLSHEMMLLQLCVHAFARDQVIKLSNIVDIFRYAVVFNDEIDWLGFIQSHPRITLMMRYARMLLDLPDSILPYVKAIDKEDAELIYGVGEGMMPLREFNNPKMTLLQRVKALLFPSPWWQCIFYAIEPRDSASLLQRAFKNSIVVRYLVHPYKMALWFMGKVILPKLKRSVSLK